MARILRRAVAALALLAVFVPAVVALVELATFGGLDSGLGPADAATGDDPSPADRGAAGVRAVRPMATTHEVGCDPTGPGGGRFAVAVGRPAGAGQITVAVDLIDVHGRRTGRVVALPAGGASAWRAVVPGLADLSAVQDCVVTAVQSDDRVRYTGW